MTRTALPLVALLVLGAGPREMAYLVISASAGVLVVGLIAGAWVDRLRRRPILVWTDIVRAARRTEIEVGDPGVLVDLDEPGDLDAAGQMR